MKKRGAGQIDWVMSLAIFLLFIAWFFVIIVPRISDQRDSSLFSDIILSKIESNISWEISETPLFVYSNISSINEPIILFSPFSNDSSFIFLDQRPFVIIDSRLMFLSNLTSSSFVFPLISSSYVYSNEHPYYGLHANDSFVVVDSASFRASFFNGLLSNVTYDGLIRIQKVQVFINNYSFVPEFSSFNDSGLLVLYRAATPELNYSSVVFSGNSRIYSFFDLKQPEDSIYSVSMQISLSNYSDYYVYPFTSGSFDPNISECVGFVSNYLDLYNSVNGVSFIFDVPANCSLCNFNDTIIFNATFIVSNHTAMKIYFHQGNYTDTLSQISPYSFAIGVPINHSGYSDGLINSLSHIGYLELKESWGFSDNLDFNWRVQNQSSDVLYSLGPEPGDFQNVYARSQFSFIIDEYGVARPVTLVVRSWMS